MNGLTRRLGVAAAEVLPRATAQAACTESWFEYRCICCGCSRPMCRQRRSCRACDGRKLCTSWTTIGTCSGSCC